MDNDEASMMNYIKDKPWYAIPFLQARNNAEVLSHYFQVWGIPTLGVANSNGTVITDWGRSALMKNRGGCLNEWKQNKSGISWFQLLSPF